MDKPSKKLIMQPIRTVNPSHTQKLLNENSTYSKPKNKILDQSASFISAIHPAETHQPHILQFSHPQITFVDVQTDKPYETVLIIRNITQQTRRVKVLKPVDPRFRVNESINRNSPPVSQQVAATIAPGLSMKVTVTFQSKALEECHSSFRVISQQFQKQISIHAYPPSANIISEQLISLGYLKVSKSKSQEFVISNEGVVGTDVTLTCQSTDVELEPSSFHINQKQKIKVKMTLISSSIGNVHGVINIVAKQRGQSEIPYTATVVQFSKVVLNDQRKQIQELEVQPLLVGDEIQITTFIVNNTPNIANFRLHQKKTTEGMSNTNTTPEEVGREDTERILYFFPMQGKIEPYGQQKIVFTIVGKLKAQYLSAFQSYCNESKDYNTDRMENKWRYLVTFHFDDDDKDQLKLSVFGMCMIPKVRLSTNVLQFGTLGVGQSSPMVLKVENFSESAVNIVFPKLYSYTFKPDRLRIKQNSTSDINVQFKPKKVGELHQCCDVQVGSFSISLKMFGVGKFVANLPTLHHTNSTGNLNSSSIVGSGRTNFNASMHYSIADHSMINKTILHPLPNQSIDVSTMQHESDLELTRISALEDHNASLVHSNSEQGSSFLKILRKQRSDKKKEQEMSKIVSECKTYEQTKPMDYEFQSKKASINLCHESIPKLEMKKDPLYIDKRLAKMAPSSLDRTSPNGFNNIFQQNKEAPEYPSAPKNQNEERMIAAQLAPEELRLVQVGPTNISIDNIFLHAEKSATFHIVNGNKQSIAVELMTNSEELAKSKKGVQILPANSHGGLKIIFTAMRLGQFRHIVQYILNGKHFFDFTVLGNVILPNLSISKNDIKFFFTEQDKEFSKQQQISIRNSYDYPARFKWIVPKEKIFQVSPEEGTVPPNTDLPIKVKYNVNNSGKEFQMQNRIDQEKLKLRVVDGNQLSLKCSSTVTESSCTVKPSEINFKEISVCKRTEQRFFIKNSSRVSTVFSISYPTEYEKVLEVSPQKKHLAPEENAEILVKIYSNTSGTVDTNLTVTVRCGKTLLVPIKGNIILPKVYIEEEEIDFGSTPKSGTPAIKVVKLCNDSNIPVDLELNLGNDNVLFRCLDLELKDQTEQSLSIVSAKSKDAKQFKLYQLKINPKSVARLNLKFTPEDIMTYNFLLPLNISGYPEYIPELQRTAICKGILNKLMVEPNEVDFKRVIIHTQKGLTKQQEIRVTNPSDQEIEWWVSSDDITPFQLSKTRDRLQPNETEVIKVSFYPTKQGEFLKKLDFFIDEPEMELTHCYTNIMLKASSDYPCIIFDRPYLLMPVVPLCVQSKAVFEIINDGYESINLKHIIVQELSNIDININYLNGASLGITKKKMKVECTFKSDKPLSFTLKIQFYDDNNRVYVLPVSGTCDNSTYTIQEYLKPISEENMKSETELQANYLKRYFNNNFCSQRPIGRFPESFFDNHMELLYEVLSIFSPSFEKIKVMANVKKGAKIQVTLQSLDQIIRVLKSEGCLLNHIRPELLLTYTDFQAYAKSPEQQQSRDRSYYQIPWLDAEQVYNVLNHRCWIVLLYQLIRTYSSLKISTTQGVKSGKSKELKQDESANRMTMEERQLVSWAESIYNSESRLETNKVLQDFSGLMDCEVFSTLIQKYTSARVLDSYGKPTNKQQIERRCRKVIDVLNSLSYSTHIEAADLERSNHREMLLLMEQMYQILPNYLPKSQSILFSCSLGQSVCKAIEISNPSKYPVNYWAKVEGSKDFVMQSEPSFRIDPKKSFEFKVKYLSHFSSEASATITFIGKKDSRSVPATMVFILKGVTVGRVSQKCVQVTVPLYEQLEFQVSVVNNFSTNAEFKVTLTNDKKQQQQQIQQQACTGKDKNKDRDTATGLLSSSNNNNNHNSYFAFTCMDASIKIRKGDTNIVKMVFCPMVMTTQKCYIFFSDPTVGEFQYEVVGIVEMPLISSETLRLPSILFVETPTTAEVAIPIKNELMTKARRLIDERKSKARVPSTYPKLMPEPYSVQMIPSTDMITFSKEVFLPINEEEDSTSTNSGQKKEEYKKLALNLNVKMVVKDGVVILLLKNQSRTDIRRYRVLLNVVNKPFKYIMEIKTHLYKQVIQPVPLINPTQQNNTYLIQLVQDSRQNFAIECDKEVHVEPGKTEYVNLIFRPKCVGQCIASLKMENITLGQLIDYELVGVGEEPESVELNYKLAAGTTQTQEIKVVNSTNTMQKYNAKLVLGCGTGPAQLIVPPLSSVNYLLTLSPRFINLENGVLTLEQDGRCLSYKINVDSRETQPCKEFNLVAKQRIPCYVDIEVEPGAWTVSSSDENLMGPKEFISTPEKGKYRATYVSGRKEQKVCYVYFRHQSKGDFSYQVNVNVVDAPEVKLNPFKVELGKTHVEVLQLENIERTKLKVVGKSNNPGTFWFEPPSIVLGAKSKTPVKVFYTPSSLEIETSEIIFEAETGQKWRYQVSGLGILPTYEQEKIVEGSVNEDTSTFVNFRNPFKQKIKVIISLDKGNYAEGVFQLIMKNRRVEIEPLAQISIPIVFSPKLNQRHVGTLNVYMNERMSWKFSIIGVCVSTSPSLYKSLKFKCRERKNERLDIYIPDLPEYIPPEQDEWTIKLKEVSNMNLMDLIEKSVVVSPTVSKLITVQPSRDMKMISQNEQLVVGKPIENVKKEHLKYPQQKLCLSMDVAAFKPFSTVCTYEITQKNQCRWLYKIDIKCLEPEPDDEITMVSEINNSSSVSFRLTNRFKVFTKFNAYFTAESDIELSVHPKTGELSPYGKEGTNFTIMFTPTEYRKTRTGKLIIETEESYWSYIVKGMLPQYNPPVGISSIGK